MKKKKYLKFRKNEKEYLKDWLKNNPETYLTSKKMQRKIKSDLFSLSGIKRRKVSISRKITFLRKELQYPLLTPRIRWNKKEKGHLKDYMDSHPKRKTLYRKADVKELHEKINLEGNNRTIMAVESQIFKAYRSAKKIAFLCTKNQIELPLETTKKLPPCCL